MRAEPLDKRRIQAPPELNRNATRAAQAGPEKTGRILMDLVCERLGLRDLSGLDVLDVGCGVRFTQAIINCDIPIGSYTGIDVERKVIDFLVREVEDPRFRFAHWDVRNDRYNSGSTTRMTPEAALPVDGNFDLIWLFSVFTHLAPDDANAMLSLLRRCVRPRGHLFFSAFIRDGVETYVEAAPDDPLLMSTYGEAYLRKLVEQNGWRILGLYPRDPDRYVQHHLVCAPSGGAKAGGDLRSS